jgi:hypothetical protein
MAAGAAAVTDKKKKTDFPHPWQGLGILIEGGMTVFKWMMIFAILAVLFGLGAIGFAIAWLK